MRLTSLLQNLKSPFLILKNQHLIENISIENIAIDSRLATKNSIFCAFSGTKTSGLNFIENAVSSGAKVVITSDKFLQLAQNIKDEVVVIFSQKQLEFLAEILSKFYSPLPENIYAITGTNGKTSIAELTRQLFVFLGKKSASIGTLGVKTNEKIDNFQNSSLTTSDIVSFYKNLFLLKKNNIDDVAIEASSIGLEQQRILGINLYSGAFSNFTCDHLDYHENLENYFESKMLLFTKYLNPNKFAVLNSDIVEYEKIKKICENKSLQIIDYGKNAKSLRIKNISSKDFWQEVEFCYENKDYKFSIKVGGEFQIYNIMCALGNILGRYNLNHQELTQLVANFKDLKSATGRMDLVETLKNNAQIFIDFAHSPDALMNILKFSQKISKNRIIILFGCGGNRDKTKRPQMGKIACEFADLVIVTDDNPRLENASEIRSEILQACDMKKTIEIAGRKEAILQAIKMLEKDDILILAGKGHEKYQIIGENKQEFDEELIVKNAVRNIY